MNDCYWGGDNGQLYYECDTGRIVGELKTSSISGTSEAYYLDSWNKPQLGKYIDEDRARKAVEFARKQDVEKWERMRKAWNTKPTFNEIPDWEEPVAVHKKTWWKIWE